MAPQGRSRTDIKNEQGASRLARSRRVGTVVLMGIFPWGPIQTPTKVIGEADFIRKFGATMGTYYSTRMARWMLTHGVDQLIVNRVVHMNAGAVATAAKSSHTFTTDSATYSGQNTLTVEALWPGTRGDDLSVKIQAASNGDAERFDLLVYENGVLVENHWFRNLSMLDTDSRYVETVINTSVERSWLITVSDLDVGGASGVAADQRPANVAATSLTGGDDGLASLDDNDYIGSAAYRDGLYALSSIEEGTFLICPDNTTTTFQNAAISYCENDKAGKLLFIPDPPASSSYTAISTHADTLTSSECSTRVYWPRVKIPNPDKTVYGAADTNTVPPSALVVARANRNIQKTEKQYWTNPSNDTYGLLEGCVGLETDPVAGTGGVNTANDKAVLDYVSDHNVNPIVSGIRPSGGNFGVWVNDCRLLKTDGNFVSFGEATGMAELRWRIEQYMERYRTQGMSPDDRRMIAEGIQAELLQEMKLKAFASSNPDEAFYVDTDIAGETINNPLTQESFTQLVKVGVATQRPALFQGLIFGRDDRAIKSYLQQQLQGAGQ